MCGVLIQAGGIICSATQSTMLEFLLFCDWSFSRSISINCRFIANFYISSDRALSSRISISCLDPVSVTAGPLTGCSLGGLFLNMGGGGVPSNMHSKWHVNIGNPMLTWAPLLKLKLMTCSLHRCGASDGLKMLRTLNSG